MMHFTECIRNIRKLIHLSTINDRIPNEPRPVLDDSTESHSLTMSHDVSRLLFRTPNAFSALFAIIMSLLHASWHCRTFLDVAGQKWIVGEAKTLQAPPCDWCGLGLNVRLCQSSPLNGSEFDRSLFAMFQHFWRLLEPRADCSFSFSGMNQ